MNHLSSAFQMSSKDKPRDRRLQRAGEHVSRLWFPVNQALLEKIRVGLAEGTYDLDIDFLLSELKTDFALFTYCIREVMRLVQREKSTAPAVASPLDLLRWAGIGKLKAILSAESSSISAHDLEKMSDMQAQRLREAMTSASTAEVLASRDEVDEELGFSVGLLRQLGLTLIAWNYPTVYKRVFSSLKTEESLDQELTTILGFSPSTLAMSLVEQWGLSEEVISAVGERDTTSEDIQGEKVKAVATTLQKICRVGEALARANDPEHYPTASRDWDLARSEIQARLGFEGIKIIQEKVKENCENYISAMPRLFSSLSSLNPEESLHKHQERALYQNNQFVKHCSPELKAKFRVLYSKINPQTVDRETVAMLVKDIIPFSGFNAGCIFVLEPSSMTLEPRVKFGNTALRQLRSTPVREDSAFMLNTPVLENGAGQGKPGMASIAATLGEQHRAGLIYLEVPQTEIDQGKENKLLVFKAIRQAFMDCLNLS